MSNSTIAGLRKRAHLLAMGSGFTLAFTGVLIGAAWLVDAELISGCSWSAVFMAVFFFAFFTEAIDLYDKAARMERRNTELLKLRGSDRE